MARVRRSERGPVRHGPVRAQREAYTDVTADIRQIETTRGRQRALDQFSPGTCTLVLDDNAGVYSNLLGSTAVPNVAVRIRALQLGTGDPRFLFTGYVDSWTPGWTQGQYSDTTITITATDGFKPLQKYKPTPAGNNAIQQTADARIGAILDHAGWPAADRTLDVSTTQIAATTLTASALDDIQATVLAEQGRVYMGPDGKIVFENRNHRLTSARSNTSLDTWESRTNVGFLTFESCSYVYDDTLVQNTISAQRSGGVLITAQDATSVADNFEDDVQQTSLLLTTDDDVQAWADWQLYLNKNAEQRFESITVRPLVQGTSDYVNKVIDYLISDRLTVIVYPPRGNPISQVSYIEGIDHTITTEPQDWTVTFHLSSAAQTQNMLVFDDPNLGKLDSGTFARW